MLRLCNNSWLAMALALVVSGCVPQGGKGGQGSDKEYTLGRKVDAQLRDASGYMQKQQWDKALAELETDPSSLNPYEKARILQMKAQIRLLSDQVEAGVKDLEEAVALNAMPEKEQLQAEYLLGQAYMHQERFPEAADTFDKWLAKTKQPTADNYFDVARALARAKRFNEAAPHAKKAVELSAKPEEPKLALLAWILVELKQHGEAAAVQQQLIAAFPKKEYWLQLAQTYLDMKDNRKAMETLEVPYAKGLLKEDTEFVTLARLYLKGGEPAKGAELLQKQMESGKIEKSAHNMELLASCFIKSGDTDRGTATLEVVGKQVSSGQVFLDLARVHFGKQAWEPARDALAKAVMTGGLRSPGGAQLLLGITHYKLRRKDAAQASLAQAKRYPSASKCAEAWAAAIKKNKKDVTETDCSTAELAIKDPPPVQAKPDAAKPGAAKSGAAKPPVAAKPKAK